MTYEVFISRSAENDVRSVIPYIYQENPQSANNVLNDIRNVFEDLKTMSNRGRIVPELLINNISGYREMIVSQWRILYRIGKDTVYVLAVLDSRRNISDLLNKRLLF